MRTHLCTLDEKNCYLLGKYLACPIEIRFHEFGATFYFRNIYLICRADGDIPEDICEELEDKSVSWEDVLSLKFLHTDAKEPKQLVPWRAPPHTVFIMDTAVKAEEFYTKFLALEDGTYRQAYMPNEVEAPAVFEQKQKRYFKDRRWDSGLRCSF